MKAFKKAAAETAMSVFEYQCKFLPMMPKDRAKILKDHKEGLGLSESTATLGPKK